MSRIKQINFLLSFVLLFIFFAAMGIIYGAIPQKERAALIALYNSTNGDNWDENSGWKDAPLSNEDGFAEPGSENKWYGIVCDETNTCVNEINLENNNLVGSIPSELGNLSNLEGLFLNSNQLKDAIPAELGNLTKLNMLYLDSNQLTGAIPPGLGNLSELIILYLDSNQLTGTIPPGLGNLKNLTQLSLYYNQLEDSIPSELGNLFNLQYLYLDSNRLTGSIPPELGNLSNLQYLYLNSNRLTGAIPWQLGSLSNLTDLFLYNNQLTGSIPSELGNLSKLTSLYLDSNRLEGAIPKELGELSILKHIYLNSNKLKGEIPGEIGNLTNLDYSESDFRWNGLYTNNDSIRNLLNDAQIEGNWQSTQTIAPTNVTARVISNNSIEVNWDPITYTDDEGGYLLCYSLTSDSTCEKFFKINTKYDSRMNTGLNPTDKYYFEIKTWTDPHENNQNKIVSDPSGKVSVEKVIFISGRIVTQNGRGVKGVTLDFSPSNTSTVTDSSGYYRHAVNTNWSGTVRPTKTGYCFYPEKIELNNVNMDQSGKNFTANLGSRNLAGKVTVSGEGVAGVTLTFSTPQDKKEIEKTNADGYYSHNVPYGWTGTVTPSKGDLLFYPSFKNYTQPVIGNKNNEDYQLSISFPLFNVDRQQDKTMIISKEYGDIKINVKLEENATPAVQKFKIYRKEFNGSFSPIQEYVIQEQKNSYEFTYRDEYLEKGKTYIYIVRAIDSQGKIIGESKEKTI